MWDGAPTSKIGRVSVDCGYLSNIFAYAVAYASVNRFFRVVCEIASPVRKTRALTGCDGVLDSAEVHFAFVH